MKKILLFCAILLSCTTSIHANENFYATKTTSTVETRKDVLIWKYKNINGKLYKRLYNQTKGRWEGDWIRV